MRILSIDRRIERRIRIRTLLDLTGNSYVLREICNVCDLEPGHDCSNYRLAFIGGEDVPETLQAITWLRGAMPGRHLVAICNVAPFDDATPARLRDAGAGLVLDLRYSATKMAMMLERFLTTHAPRDAAPIPGASALTRFSGRE